MAAPALPAAPPVQRPRVLIVGSAFVSAAMIMTFIGLIGIYLTQRAAIVGAGDTWLPKGSTIPLQQPNTMLFTLLMSVVTMQWAVHAIARNDRVNAYLALAITLFFGLSTIVMTWYLYGLMTLDISTSSQAVLIYTITGLHLLVLVVAMLFIALMAFRALAGSFDARQHDGITAAAVFWYAVVAVYALIWITIYVTK
ncbi:MAG: cytochrome c oxidase subunit 3 [Acidobacteria bacterium]|nr:cytochrome c oxidase subunit 3 [Acidobacteriota bacterium]